MIARIWRGWAPAATADDYQRHYETEVSEHLHLVSGFSGAQLLRQEDDQEVMFTSITFFTSLDAVRGFAGDDYEAALVEEAGRLALSHWDERVSHHEVVASALYVRGQLAAWGYAAKMPRGRVIDTTQLGRSTVSLIFRSPATLHRA
jgi:hypothetical protein